MARNDQIWFWKDFFFSISFPYCNDEIKWQPNFTIGMWQFIHFFFYSETSSHWRRSKGNWLWFLVPLIKKITTKLIKKTKTTQFQNITDEAWFFFLILDYKFLGIFSLPYYCDWIAYMLLDLLCWRDTQSMSNVHIICLWCVIYFIGESIHNYKNDSF